MKLLCERTAVRDVAARWDEAYGHYGADYRLYGGASPADISTKLHALDPETATASDVAAIIGNRSWAGADKCDECKAEVNIAMQVGAEPDYDSATATICGPCLRKALAIIEAHESTASARGET